MRSVTVGPSRELSPLARRSAALRALSLLVAVLGTAPAASGAPARFSVIFAHDRDGALDPCG